VRHVACLNMTYVSTRHMSQQPDATVASRREISYTRLLIREPLNKEPPPGGGGFLRSICVYHQVACRYKTYVSRDIRHVKTDYKCIQVALFSTTLLSSNCPSPHCPLTCGIFTRRMSLETYRFIYIWSLRFIYIYIYTYMYICICIHVYSQDVCL